MKIGVDIDSVLAEAMPTFLDSIRERHGLELKKEDIKEWNMKWGNIDLYEEICFVLYNKPRAVVDMSLVDGADKGMKYLLKNYDVKLITSRKEPETTEITRKWVDKNFGSIEVLHTDTDKNGYDVDILIDDAPHHVESFSKKGGWAILFDQPWNQDVKTEPGNHIIRAKDWDDVLLKVEWIRLFIIMERNLSAG